MNASDNSSLSTTGNAASPYNAFAAALQATSAWSAAGASGSSAKTKIFVINDAAAAAQSSWASPVNFSSRFKCWGPMETLLS